MILAGIVLYNPDLDRLRDNIGTLKKQIEKIIFVDNSTTSVLEKTKVKNMLLQDNKNVYIDNNGNLGVAKALNQILDYALRHDCKWVLTLDQDTICPLNLIKEYSKYTCLSDVGIICPKIIDRNFEYMNYDNGKTEFIEYCITSASLTNTAIWNVVGGFSEELFIDYVDFDYCLNLKRNNFKIMRVNTVEILHEIGHAKTYHFFGKKFLTFNHPPIRNYYIVRNKLICAYKYKDIVNVEREKKEILTHILRVVFFENNKIDNIRYLFDGIKDGKKMISKMEI